ncbi:DNA alkylation repair protein [Coriobacteriales bacterium OH1046]|nr:DNA alkylation repair protein [Coriobacteriales bacterium OH1046]
MDILQMLFDMQDKEYASFQSRLVPGIAPERFIGVRVPEARKLAKALAKQVDYSGFLRQVPHEYYDEDMLHGLLVSEIKDYETCISEVELFLPYVDNWAVCDIMSPKAFKSNRNRLIEKIKAWSASDHTYTCRFGLEMLMSHFLDDDFRPEYLEIPASVRSDEYYVNMMVAWFFATALTKRWGDALPYLEHGRLEIWTHNKTIQKARESFRITREQKEQLKLLKR